MTAPVVRLMCQRRLADRLEMAAANAAVAQGWSWTEVAVARALQHMGVDPRALRASATAEIGAARAN